MSVLMLVISTALVNNVILSACFGVSPVLGFSGKKSRAFEFGVLVSLVILVTALIMYVLNTYALAPLHLTHFRILLGVLASVSVVQLLILGIQKIRPQYHESVQPLIPLLNLNSAVLGLALVSLQSQFSFVETLFYALGAGLGLTLVLVILAEIRGQLEYADIPAPFRGIPIALIVMGCLSMVFIGFASLQ